jgi:hypothetical protein
MVVRGQLLDDPGRYPSIFPSVQPGVDWRHTEPNQLARSYTGKPAEPLTNRTVLNIIRVVE